MTDTPQKQAVRSWLTLVTTGQIRKAYEMHTHPDFRHHNQYFPGDKESLIGGMEENEKNFPNKKFAVKKMLEEGDTVITFSSIELGGNMPPMAVVHIFRFADGKIIELWDVGQQIAADSPNENGAF